MNTDCYDDLIKACLCEEAARPTKQSPSRRGGDCFAPLLRNSLRFLRKEGRLGAVELLLRNSLRFLRKEGRLGAVELLAMTLRDCLCVRLLGFFSGLTNINMNCSHPSIRANRDN